MTSTLPKARPVLIFNRRKKLTVIASSINEAAKYASRSPGNISKVCNGKHISDGNYYYRYIDDNVEIDFSDLGTLTLSDYDKLCGVDRKTYATECMNRKNWKYKKNKNES